MPKERHHMLLAQESLRLLESGGGSFRLGEREKYSFLLGSIFPDVLFYDLPSSRLPSIGRSLHRFEGEKILPFAGAWLTDVDAAKDRDLWAWILGLSSHYLADGYYHPSIRTLSIGSFPPCAALRLSAGDCHHWLESAMEGCWIRRIGPSDGYFGLLDRFRDDARRRSKYIGFFREFMVRAEVEDVPEAGKIARCLVRQTLLLKEFAEKRWAKLRPWLLGTRRGRSLGCFLVPAGPDSSGAAVPSTSEVEGTVEGSANLFSHKSMARAVIYLTTRLSSLPARP